MPSYEQLSELLDPATTVLLTVECQQGVVGTGRARCPNSPRRHARRARSPTSPGWSPPPTRAGSRSLHADRRAPARRARRQPQRPPLPRRRTAARPAAVRHHGGADRRPDRGRRGGLRRTTAARAVARSGHRRRRPAAQPGLPHAGRDRCLGQRGDPERRLRRREPRLHRRRAVGRHRGGALRLHPRDDPPHPRPGRHGRDHGRGAGLPRASRQAPDSGQRDRVPAPR